MGSCLRTGSLDSEDKLSRRQELERDEMQLEIAKMGSPELERDEMELRHADEQMRLDQDQLDRALTKMVGRHDDSEFQLSSLYQAEQDMQEREQLQELQQMQMEQLEERIEYQNSPSSKRAEIVVPCCTVLAWRMFKLLLYGPVAAKKKINGKN